ncbi:MAG: hypothetical protein JWN44_3926 [Myxococcales bacterium]|nr:hypothetical protein [Myxococcales bacterium]
MRQLFQGAAVVAILLAIVTVRVVWSSHGEWRAAQALGGDDEIAHLGRAARLYAPGNPYSRRAVEKLAAIGRDEPARALVAWRELRSALFATRSFYTPRRALLEEANARIAELMADAEVQSGAQKSHDRDKARAWHAARLAQDESPSVPWTLLALFGLAAWIGCALGLLLRGIGDDDRLRPRAAMAWAAGVACGLLLFFLGLSRA